MPPAPNRRSGVSEVAEPNTLIFYSSESAPALALAEKMRTPEHSPQLREVSGLMAFDRKPGRVIIMPDVPKHYRAKLRELYPDICEEITETRHPQEPLPIVKTTDETETLLAPPLTFVEPPRRKRNQRAR